VIGAGVSGLTAAAVLAERGHDVEVFAEKIGRATTSAIAAAIWFPYHIGDATDPASLAKVARWGQRTAERLKELIPSDGRPDPRIGVSMIEFRVISRNALSLPPWEWARPRVLTDIPRSWNFGYSVDVPLMETPIYLQYLEDRVGRERIRLGERIARLADVDASFSAIVNCTGIAGPHFSNDDQSPMHPGRGIVILGRTAQPFALLDADQESAGQLLYIIPRPLGGICVIGGSDTNDANETPNANEVAAIFERCAAADPSLSADRRTAIAGLRPHRQHGVRLEREEIDGRAVIHNYGHGGGGFTVSWGCAEDVADLVDALGES
jgi:D-amino-acid oxidase